VFFGPPDHPDSPLSHYCCFKVNFLLVLVLMVAAVMTQWNTSADCWDWGMGWGWAGWSASYCDTCALEHAAVTAHVAAGHAPLSTNFSETLVRKVNVFLNQINLNANKYIWLSLKADPKPSSVSQSFRSTHDLYVFDDDNEVTELGETDVACDFGDFGGF